MVAALVVFLKGSLEICQGVAGLMHAVSYFVPTSADDKIVILAFIPAIDTYLWATVLMIFSMGMHERPSPCLSLRPPFRTPAVPDTRLRVQRALCVSR